MLKTVGKSIVATSLLIGLSACGSGFQAAQLASSPDGNGTSGGGGIGGGNTDNPSDAAWKQLSVDGAVSGGQFDGVQVVGIDKEKKELIVRLPMFANPFLDGSKLSIPVQEIPGAHLGLEPLPDGGSVLALRIPLEHVLRGVKFLPPQRLPNGDPLPAIPDGELPSVAVQLSRVKDTKATIYLAPSVIGIFVNTSFDPYIRLTLPIRNEARTRTWGYFSTIPAKKDVAEGGFFLSIALPDDLARIIDDHL